jgi:hypothetical protein
VTTVVHCKKAPYDIYIGRPSKWGNPWSHKDRSVATYKVATVADAVEQFRAWVWLPMNANLRAEARKELRGKVLGCWCDRPPCHGWVWVAVADSEGDE